MPSIPRVLLVDDRADKLIAMDAILSSLNIEIHKVRSGPEAIVACEQFTYVVILLDVRMPGMDGFETATAIRKLRCCAHTPIIFVSAAESPELIEKGYALGAVDYVQALVGPVLRTKVSVFLDLFRNQQELLQERELQMKLRYEKQQAERANEAKDRFIAALSHELRTPLTPVIALLPALLESKEIPQDLREDLRMIYRNVQIEAQLVNDLLDLSSITKGQFPLNLQKNDVHPLIEHAISIATDEARSKGIRLHRELFATKSYAWVDMTRLRQVLWNLLRNAILYTPAEGSVWIRTRNEAQGKILVEVADNGIGFSTTESERLFEQFERPAAADGFRFGGLGLGLFISQNIVARHGGRLIAKSPGKGQGATFHFELSAIEVPFPALGELSLARVLTHRPLRILLVEDHESTRGVISRLLVRRGHFVMAAETVYQALEIAAGNEFDLIVSDLGLPDGTGNDLMIQLKSLYGLRGIAMSGYGMEEDVRKSHAAGFEAHLTKPVEFGALEAALRKFTEGDAAK